MCGGTHSTFKVSFSPINFLLTAALLASHSFTYPAMAKAHLQLLEVLLEYQSSIMDLVFPLQGSCTQVIVEKSLSLESHTRILSSKWPHCFTVLFRCLDQEEQGPHKIHRDLKITQLKTSSDRQFPFNQRAKSHSLALLGSKLLWKSPHPTKETTSPPQANVTLVTTRPRSSFCTYP